MRGVEESSVNADIAVQSKARRPLAALRGSTIAMSASA